jgi:endonuclease/exonuclease/phosphatase family metal-dependent hydrolase
MPQYTYAGVGRKDGIMAGEYSAVFYKKDKLSYYNGGTFWLSENPSAVGVKGWDASLERIVTWVILKDKISGKKIAVFNTHFDHIGVLARKESARLLINKIDELSMGLPVIATGDLNSTPDSEALKTITDQSNPKHLTDTRSIANMIEGPGWTMHDFGKTAESQRRIIDYILVKNAIIAELHKTIFEMRGNLYLSDHNPVFAKLTVN